VTPAAAIARRCLLPAIERPEPVAKPEPARRVEPAPGLVTPRRKGQEPKPCTVAGVAYPSYSMAAAAHGVVSMTVLYRCEHLDWPTWTAPGVDKWRGGESARGKAVRHGADRYRSASAAAHAKGVSVSAVSKWCKSGKDGWRYE
jgi:hypothetical protein